MKGTYVFRDTFRQIIAKYLHYVPDKHARHYAQHYTGTTSSNFQESRKQRQGAKEKLLLSRKDVMCYEGWGNVRKGNKLRRTESIWMSNTWWLTVEQSLVRAWLMREKNTSIASSFIVWANWWRTVLQTMLANRGGMWGTQWWKVVSVELRRNRWARNKYLRVDGGWVDGYLNPWGK